MVVFRITENEPSKMHNVRPYVYSRPCIIQFPTVAHPHQGTITKLPVNKSFHDSSSFRNIHVLRYSSKGVQFLAGLFT